MTSHIARRAHAGRLRRRTVAPRRPLSLAASRGWASVLGETVLKSDQSPWVPTVRHPRVLAIAHPATDRISLSRPVVIGVGPVCPVALPASGCAPGPQPTRASSWGIQRAPETSTVSSGAAYRGDPRLTRTGTPSRRDPPSIGRARHRSSPALHSRERPSSTRGMPPGRRRAPWPGHRRFPAAGQRR